MSSRRELLRLLGIAPVAAKSVVSDFVALASAPSTKIAMAALNANQVGMPVASSATAFGAVLGRRLEFLREVAEAQEYRRDSMREHGLEPDIAALKSTSRAYKIAKQIERDFSTIQTNVRARRTLWGDMTGIDD